MSFEMIPYVERNGVRTFSDNYMKDLYERCVDEGHAETVFYEGTVRTADDFVTALKKSICWVVAKDDVALAVVWLTRHEGRFARFHFIIFEDCLRKEIRKLGRFALNSILHMTTRSGEFCYDLLLGYIPVRNKGAINYVLKSGAHFVGEIPNGAWIAREGTSEPVMVVSVTRESLYENLH
ncbi:hypothetical protein [Maridesulfovibrio sp.]|uniref:hypothetical protein n=1 Tax=Maridesulfovibrio sp. TaxID=2795000 RepID=UPI0029C9ECA9|nr:hypothetical protein [Maridesulfovibrio sp.]